MKDAQRRTYEMFARVRDFGAANAADFPDGSKGKDLFDELESVLAQLGGHAEAQVSTQGAARGGSASRRAARERLRDQLESVARTARAMSVERPELAEQFRLPRGANDQTLILTARSFRANATPLKADFIRHEMPADFLEELAASIADFESAITEQNTGRAARSAATAAVEEATARGSAVVRQLDAVVRNKLRDDAARLAAWEAASRTERAPRKTPPPAPPEQQKAEGSRQ